MAKMPETARLPTQNQLATLNQLRRRKKLILFHHLSNKKHFDLQTEQLDKEEEIVDKGIALLEEELHLTAKEEKEEGEEVEHGSIIRDLLGEHLEDVDENLAAGASDVKTEEESAEEMCGRKEQAEETRACVKCGRKEWQRQTKECCWKVYGIDCVFKEKSQETAWWYARKWQEQGGDAVGIPKKYTPCSYFFKARFGCQKDEACDFSHNREIFDVEMLRDFSWEMRGRKTFARPRPCQERKKHRRADEEEDSR